MKASLGAVALIAALALPVSVVASSSRVEQLRAAEHRQVHVIEKAKTVLRFFTNHPRLLCAPPTKGQCSSPAVKRRAWHAVALARQRIIRTRVVLAATRAALRRAEIAHRSDFRIAQVVGYSTSEDLTGCYAPGRCRTACGHDLNDRAFTVAANPALGLACGARIVLCRSPGRGCVGALVADRTASRFTFELTRALAAATGSPAGDWAGPRLLYWARVYR